MKDFLQSNMFKKLLAAIGILILALLIFQAGMLVGYRKAGFSYNWGENYSRNFGGGRMGRPPMMGIFRDDFQNGHGATGQILKISLPTFVMQDQDHNEKVISISDDTTIRQMHADIKPADLKTGDTVVVIGSPNNNGEIEASFVRLMSVDFFSKTSGQTGTSTKSK